MPEAREVREGPQPQGVDEQIPYTLTTTPWGSTPTSPSMVVKDLTNAGEDVTATVAPDGSIGTSGDVLTLKTIKLLKAGHEYRVEVKFTSGGKVLEPFFIIKAEE